MSEGKKTRMSDPSVQEWGGVYGVSGWRNCGLDDGNSDDFGLSGLKERRRKNAK